MVQVTVPSLRLWTVAKNVTLAPGFSPAPCMLSEIEGGVHVPVQDETTVTVAVAVNE